MNVLSRLKELEDKVEIMPDGIMVSTFTGEEILEYRALASIRNILVSKTGSSNMDSSALKFIMNKLQWDVSDFKVGQFFY